MVVLKDSSVHSEGFGRVSVTNRSAINRELFSGEGDAQTSERTFGSQAF